VSLASGVVQLPMSSCGWFSENSPYNPGTSEDVQTPLLPTKSSLRQLTLEEGHEDVGAVGSYLSTCKEHQVLPCADALIRLQLGSGDLCIVPENAARPFGNMEMRALVGLLEQDEGSRLSSFRSLNVSRCTLGTSGVMLVGRLLCHPKCCFEEVDVSHQYAGEEGAYAIATGVRKCKKTLRVLKMYECGLGKGGGQVFAELLREGAPAHGLKSIDFCNNSIGTNLSTVIEAASLEQDFEVVLYGNRVFDEILNAVTHGLGFAFAILGTVLLFLACRGKPAYWVHGVLPYSASLIFLFMSSMLYHSFHALGPLVNQIFCAFDHFAIYCLIAGTYTPFLVILFGGVWWATILLTVIWSMAALGTCVTICYHGRHKVHVENAIYLFMGWMICPFCTQLISKIGYEGFYWLLAGGVLYTLGIPWFLKDGKTCGVPDHTIWHIFVLAAAVCHWLCVYWFVVHGTVLTREG